MKMQNKKSYFFLKKSQIFQHGANERSFLATRQITSNGGKASSCSPTAVHSQMHESQRPTGKIAHPQNQWKQNSACMGHDSQRSFLTSVIQYVQ